MTGPARGRWNERREGAAVTLISRYPFRAGVMRAALGALIMAPQRGGSSWDFHLSPALMGEYVSRRPGRGGTGVARSFEGEASRMAAITAVSPAIARARSGEVFHVKRSADRYVVLLASWLPGIPETRRLSSRATRGRAVECRGEFASTVGGPGGGWCSMWCGAAGLTQVRRKLCASAAITRDPYWMGWTHQRGHIGARRTAAVQVRKLGIGAGGASPAERKASGL